MVYSSRPLLRSMQGIGTQATVMVVLVAPSRERAVLAVGAVKENYNY